MLYVHGDAQLNLKSYANAANRQQLPAALAVFLRRNGIDRELHFVNLSQTV